MRNFIIFVVLVVVFWLIADGLGFLFGGDKYQWATAFLVGWAISDFIEENLT